MTEGKKGVVRRKNGGSEMGTQSLYWVQRSRLRGQVNSLRGPFPDFSPRESQLGKVGAPVKVAGGGSEMGVAGAR